MNSKVLKSDGLKSIFLEPVVSSVDEEGVLKIQKVIRLQSSLLGYFLLEKRCLYNTMIFDLKEKKESGKNSVEIPVPWKINECSEKWVPLLVILDLNIKKLGKELAQVTTESKRMKESMMEVIKTNELLNAELKRFYDLDLRKFSEMMNLAVFQNTDKLRELTSRLRVYEQLQRRNKELSGIRLRKRKELTETEEFFEETKTLVQKVGKESHDMQHLLYLCRRKIIQEYQCLKLLEQQDSSLQLPLSKFSKRLQIVSQNRSSYIPFVRKDVVLLAESCESNLKQIGDLNRDLHKLRVILKLLIAEKESVQKVVVGNLAKLKKVVLETKETKLAFLNLKQEDQKLRKIEKSKVRSLNYFRGESQQVIVKFKKQKALELMGKSDLASEALDDLFSKIVSLESEVGKVQRETLQITRQKQNLFNSRVDSTPDLFAKSKILGRKILSWTTECTETKKQISRAKSRLKKISAVLGKEKEAQSERLILLIDRNSAKQSRLDQIQKQISSGEQNVRELNNCLLKEVKKNDDITDLSQRKLKKMENSLRGIKHIDGSMISMSYSRLQLVSKSLSELKSLVRTVHKQDLSKIEEIKEEMSNELAISRKTNGILKTKNCAVDNETRKLKKEIEQCFSKFQLGKEKELLLKNRIGTFRMRSDKNSDTIRRLYERNRVHEKELRELRLILEDNRLLHRQAIQQTKEISLEKLSKTK